MPLFHCHRITKLATRLDRIERGLLAIKADAATLPTPDDMQSLVCLRAQLPRIITICGELEPELWARVRAWQRTPWTPWQRRLRGIAAFFGWWLVGSLTILQCVLGWFIPLFPAPWMVIPASAGAALAIMCALTICDRRKPNNNGSPAELSRVQEGNTEAQLLRL